MIAKDLQQASDIANSVMQYPIVMSEKPCRDLMVAGGLQVYEQMFQYCDSVIATHIDEEDCVYGDLGEHLPEYGEYIFADKFIKQLRSKMLFSSFKNNFGLSVSLGSKIFGEFENNISKNVEDRLKELVENKGGYKFNRKKSASDEENFEELKSLLNTKRIIIDLSGMAISEITEIKTHRQIKKAMFDNVFHNLYTQDTSFLRFETLLYGWNVVILDKGQSVLLTEILEDYDNDLFTYMDLSKSIWNDSFSIEKWQDARVRAARIKNDKRK